MGSATLHKVIIVSMEDLEFFSKEKYYLEKKITCRIDLEVALFASELSKQTIK